MTTLASTPPATLDRAWIAAHIPHDGAMCLLDRVEAWDAASIRCSATSHRDPHNPLRSRGRLASVCGIEYAAQAMAVHGALVCAQQAHARPCVGYLASVRNVDACVDRLDTFDLPLTVDAERISGDGRSVLYAFALRCGERVLLSGRAAVMLDASAAGALVPPPAGSADPR
ncbi:hotdog family protein [Burkholderia cepacia]|uniref:3-hydroxylacyl-(Acyl carrier protein) dehydratase-like protein n=1 Tax=Burkholderia cepacia GG4 TaxID=1009846 RepID=A0A9W3K1U2_BURCE|nr:hotdog family protein [Burkholderia cepacia]AFQ47122.1 3-hydroxylacyl-(acyl carrier protein) dehydratase-like protein [Burkholderia cepacia GG4]